MTTLCVWFWRRVKSRLVMEKLLYMLMMHMLSSMDKLTPKQFAHLTDKYSLILSNVHPVLNTEPYDLCITDGVSVKHRKYLLWQVQVRQRNLQMSDTWTHQKKEQRLTVLENEHTALNRESLNCVRKSTNSLKNSITNKLTSSRELIAHVWLHYARARSGSRHVT